MKNLAIILAVSICNLVYSQPIAIPDSNFEQALINLGLDAGPIDGFVDQGSIDTVTTLTVAAQGITDMTGIQNFFSLEYLNCGANLGLTTLDVSNMSLIELHAYQTGLTNINIFQCSSLEVLDLWWSSLSSIDISTNPLIVHLDLSWGNFTSIDVASLFLLETLDVSSNNLTTLDLSGNFDLTELRCANNSISMLDLTANTNLEDLYCTDNSISSLDISNCTSLEWLYCDNNNLTYLNLSNNLSLTLLSCNNNQLTQLQVNDLPMLGYIWCNDNDLNCLNVKNGNNVFMNDSSFRAINNPSLACIEVDDATYSTSTWTSTINTYSNYCGNACSSSSVGIVEPKMSVLSIYPNPSSGHVTFTNEKAVIKEIKIFDLSGRIVLEYQDVFSNKVDLDMNQGSYFVEIKDEYDVEYQKKLVVFE